MVEWRLLRTTVIRPVPKPVATPFIWATVFAGSLLLVAVLEAAAVSDPSIALGTLCVPAAPS